ncbi:MAG: DNA gyrase inhibitor YacG [Sulfuriferula sp.]|nr:DNA gyrase inhibitor YacG [Sulfuriferula sp.]
MPNSHTTTVKCPTCKTAVAWTPEQTYRPFCSERCRLIDLGAWGSEQYRVPVSGLADTSDAEQLN